MFKSQPYYIKSNNTQSQKRLNTMIYYLFPRTFINILNIYCTFGKDHNSVSRYSSSLDYYLKQVESHTRNLNDWDKICYSSNPYRLLDENHNKLIMYEVIELYHLMKFSWEGIDTLKTLHSNRNTIPAIEHIRRRNHLNDSHFFMGDFSVTEDIIDIAFCEAASTDEYANNINLLLQLSVTFRVLKKKGTCIVKYGDSFSSLSLDLMALLSHFFEKTYFLKPSVCNVTSCEKYIVCKGFLYDSNDDVLRGIFSRLYASVITCPPEFKIQRILRNDIPLFICGKLEEVNSIMGQPRLEKIQNILTNMEHTIWSDFEVIRDSDIQKCKDWCEKNNVKRIIIPPFHFQTL